jgi:hypothetical protein
MNKLFLSPLLSGPFIHDGRVPELTQSCMRSSVPMSVDPAM